MRCPVCDRDVELTLHGPAEVTVGTVAAAVEGRPAAVCTAGHTSTPPALVGAAMEAVEQQVPRARRRLLRGEVCRRCGEALTMPARRTVRSVSVEAPGLPVLTIVLDLPASRCPACGTDQVPTRSHEDLVVVIPALFAEP